MSKFIEVEHPGIMLKEDFLDDLGIKPGAIAKAIGVDRRAMKDITDGRRDISAAMSLRLGLFFKMSGGYWFNLQRDYDLRKAKRDKLSEFEKTIRPFDGAHF